MLFSDLSSYLFNLITFSGLAVVTALLLLRQRGQFSKKALYNVFLCLGIFAVLTQLSYIYAPKRIFSNASHHIIEHLGFSFKQKLKLADGENPQTALWDNKQGQLELIQKQGPLYLRGTACYEPIFVSEGNQTYKLANPIFTRQVTSSISIHWADTLSMDFNIHGPEKGGDGETYSFAPKINGKKYGPFKVKQKNLQTGYSLAGLVAESRADFPLAITIKDLLEDSWLVREKLKSGENTAPASPLSLFPSAMLADSTRSISIDGVAVHPASPLHFEIPLASKAGQSATFYIGLRNSRTRILEAGCSGPDNCYLAEVTTDKKQLKNLDENQESLFVTSSADEIADNPLLSGFFFPLFTRDDNENHFSATITYHEGNTRERMRFKIISADQNDLQEQQNRYYNAGDTIRLETVAGGAAALMRITNTKETNPLQFWHIAAFTVFLIIAIYISLYLTLRERITKTEVIAYILILVLLTVRSILLWRVSTFPPLEDISARVYNQLINDPFDYFRNGVLATFAFFVLIWIWKICGDNIATGIRALADQKRDERYLLAFAVIPYLVALGLKAIPSLERISAVFAPLTAYFIAHAVVLYYLSGFSKATPTEERKGVALLVINWVICFAYLAMSDAGFSIVFVMASLVYWLFALLAFPNLRATGVLQRFRHWQFVIPYALLLVILFASPLLLSLLFRNLKTALNCAAILLSLTSGWLAFKSETVWPGKALATRLVAGLMLVPAIAIFLAPDPILHMMENKMYIRYRAEVLFRTPDEIIQDEAFQFNLGNDSKLLRAAQNQWIINHYYEKGSWSLHDYFRILPSFQKGSPYMTQISDLVTVRYLIGEHSQFVVLQILFLMILLIFSAISTDTPCNQFSKLRLRMLCVFFSVGFFIWMAATNRMIFLGQDFPLLSLNSILTLLFSFTILFAAIMLGQLATSDRERSAPFNPFGRDLAFKLVRGLLVIGTLLLFARQYDMNTKKFDLDATARNLEMDFIPINDLFADFQQQQTDSLQSNRPNVSGLISRFDRYIGHDKDSLFKSTFSRSAYEAYRAVLSQRNGPEHLIHLRRGADGIYSFAVNKLYYNVYSPDMYDQAWTGNIMAAGNANTFSFINRDTRKTHLLNAVKYDEDLGSTLVNNQVAEMARNQNLRLSVIPAGWTPDSLPAVILSRTSGTMHENRSDFIVKNGTAIIRSTDLDAAIVLRPDDVLQFIPDGRDRPVRLQYKHKAKSYLAKNVWLNGRRQFYYPLREKFLWSYHFTNLIKNKFDNESESAIKNITSTIDGELTQEIYTLANRYFASQKVPRSKWRDPVKEIAAESARAFNLVVLDHIGRIRALCDYKHGDKVRLDPNRMHDFIRSQRAASLNADPEFDRLTFGNRCLMRMDNGPASTFKPILYSAVTSQYNFDWPQLKFGGLLTTTGDNISKGDLVLRRFGGKSGLSFSVPGNNTRPHDMDYYISHSTNTYNSMIVFLGSLQRSELDQVHRYAHHLSPEKTFWSRGVADDPRNDFPVFDYANEKYYIQRFPDWKSGKSIMARGLWENFDLPTRSEHLKGPSGQHIQNIAWNLDSDQFDRSLSTYKLWSFPEPSHIYMIDRIDLHTAVVQLATGASPIYTTPLKMAEMAGKLFSFNKDYKSTVIDGAPISRTRLIADESWRDAGELSRFYSKNLFKAMNNALKKDEQGATAGTAYNLVGSVLTKEFPDYHFYAKTGTISGNRHGGKRDKHLMLIISKKQLHDRDITPEDLQNNKFYVLYFSMYKQTYDGQTWGPGVGPVLQEMVRTVIRSATFETDMQ